MTDPTALEEALSALLSGRSDDLVADLCAAAREAVERRRANSRHGGVVIAALREQGVSWRSIEELTGIPKATAQRWAGAPPTVTDG